MDVGFPTSIRQYLETIGVDGLAIQANEKGEAEHDNYHTVELTDRTESVIKRSRVINDLVVELTLGKALVEYLPLGDRVKKMLATSVDPQHVQIESSLLTVNALAKVLDVKMLVQEEDTMIKQYFLLQTYWQRNIAYDSSILCSVFSRRLRTWTMLSWNTNLQSRNSSKVVGCLVVEKC